MTSPAKDGKRTPWALLIGLGAIVVAGAVFGLVWRSQALALQHGRDALAAHNYDEAARSASQVTLPPLSGGAADLQVAIAAARKHDEEARAAQQAQRQQYQRVAAALAALNNGARDIERARNAANAAGRDAQSAAQQRHDDAVSGAPHLDVESTQAALEQNAVRRFSSATTDLAAAYRAQVDTLGGAFPATETARLQESVESLSAQFASGVDAWEIAIREIVDTDTANENGNVSARGNEEEIQRYYSQSDDALAKARAAEDTANHEIARLTAVLRSRADPSVAQSVVPASTPVPYHPAPRVAVAVPRPRNTVIREMDDADQEAAPQPRKTVIREMDDADQEAVESPSATVRRFYDLLNKHEFAEAYALLSPDFRRVSPFEQWKAGYRTTILTIANVTQTNDPSNVPLTITAEDATSSGVVTTKFAGKWKLVPAERGWYLDTGIIHKVQSN